MKIYHYLFAIGILLLPLYLGGSGGIQIAHAVLAGAFLCSIIFRKFKLESIDFLILCLIFYIFIRESMQIVLFGAPATTLMPAVYLSFNLFLFSILRNVTSKSFIHYLLIPSVIASAAIAIFGLFVTGFNFTVGQEFGRGIGTFNNPNQLGYFAVCIFSISALLYVSKYLRFIYFLPLVVASLFLAMASLSKAAMVALIFSTSLLGYSMATNLKFRLLLGVVILTTLSSFVYVVLTSEGFSEYSFVVRLLDIGSDSDDGLEGRGYHLLWMMNAAEVVFGMSDYKAQLLKGAEVHSTIGSVVINYGIIGASLFCYFLIQWWRHLIRSVGFVSSIVLVAPPMLYGLTHNGIRFTIFWVLLSLSFYVSYEIKHRISPVLPRINRYYGALSYKGVQ